MRAGSPCPPCRSYFVLYMSFSLSYASVCIIYNNNSKHRQFFGSPRSEKAKAPVLAARCKAREPRQVGQRFSAIWAGGLYGVYK